MVWVHETQGGGEYALPWARSCAPSGRNCVDTIASMEGCHFASLSESVAINWLFSAPKGHKT